MSFIQNDSNIFCFHDLNGFNNFKVFLNHIIMVFLNAVFEHVQFVILSTEVFKMFMYVTCSYADVIFFTCWYRAVHR